ncbi:MAG: TolC family protein [Phycisphaerales bacterium]
MKTLMTLGLRRRDHGARASCRTRVGARRLFLAGLAGVAATGGCRSYERKPLELAATREAWLARSPSDESARRFAGTLGRAESDGGAVPVFDPSDGLTLGEAEPVALVFNRELRLARLRAGVLRATAEHAGLWADPVVGVDLERIVSGVAEPWVITGTVGLTIPISGRPAAEKDRAGAEYAAELQRLAAAEWATRAALRELWVEWSAQAHRARLAAELVDRLRDVAKLAERQEQAGVLSRVGARVFAVELAGSEADLIAARARASELELQLRDILGLSPQASLRLVESVAFTPRGDEGAWSRETMEQGNAELAAVRGEYEAAEQALRLEVRKQYPDLAVGPGYASDQGDDRVLLGLGLPIPLWNRNRQGVAEAAASREAARGRFESTYEHLASRLTIAQTRYEAARAVREAVESRVLPLADEQDSDVRRIAELGRVDPLLLLQGIRSRHDAKVRLVDARAAESIGAVRLDELIGPPTGGSPRGGPPASPEQPDSSANSAKPAEPAAPGGPP